ncbi:MAG TPA: hypothetical protein ENK34_11720 [Rhodobacteraceae bacterium]|nr:hypothetical protein [Paracoccaceae bacterium]
MNTNSSKHRKHPDKFAWSVYENPELYDVTERVTIIFMIVTVLLNYAAGYALATLRDDPLAQDILSFVLGLSKAFAIRFNDLQSLTDNGGYYFVGSLVVSTIASVVLCVVLVANYLRITFFSAHVVPFKSENIKGTAGSVAFTAIVVYVFFFKKMNTGPYLGMSRIFFPGIFSFLAPFVSYSIALTASQIVIFVMKFVLLRERKRH